MTTTGNDNYSCAQAASSSTPKRTLNSGIGCLRPGDTLYVRGGVYPEALDGNVPSGTSWSNTVRIAAYPGETVWMRPSGSNRVLHFDGAQQYIEFDGINLDGTNALYDVVKIDAGVGYNAHHIRLQNAELVAVNGGADPDYSTIILATGMAANNIGGNQFINLTLHGGGTADFSNSIYIQTPNNLVDGCNIYDGSGAGVQIYNGYNHDMPGGNIIRNNVIHDFTRVVTGGRADGVIIAGGTGNQIYNNLFYNIRPNASGSAVIHVARGARGHLFDATR